MAKDKQTKKTEELEYVKEKVYSFTQSEYDAWDRGGFHTGIVKHFTKYLEETQ